MNDGIAVIAHVLVRATWKRYESGHGGFYLRPIVEDLDVPGSKEYASTKIGKALKERGLVVHEPWAGHFRLTDKGLTVAKSL